VSEQNVELHRRTIEAFNARDIGKFIAFCDPTIELHSTFAELGNLYVGHDGVRRWYRELEDAFGDQLRVEPEMFFDLGEHTVAFSVWRGSGRKSQAEVALPAAQVAKWQDGTLRYIKGYAHREDALNDLGVSEDSLNPITP
jgi:hypothetical protein